MKLFTFLWYVFVLLLIIVAILQLPMEQVFPNEPFTVMVLSTVCGLYVGEGLRSSLKRLKPQWFKSGTEKKPNGTEVKA